MRSVRTWGKREKGKRFGAALLVVFFVAGFLLGEGFHSSSLAAEKGPIKIGFIAGITGNWAQFGNDMVDGFKLRLSEMNYTVAGRKVELIVEDESTNPAMAVTKARKLISHDKVSLIAGVFLASSGYAVAPIAAEEKLPLVVTIATADDLTQRKANKYLTRLNWGTSSEFGYLSADYAYKKLGWRKAAIIGYDYAWGHEVGGGFLRTFEELGGKVLQRVWTPVNTTDFGPYVTSIRREVDGICSVITGAATIRLINSVRMSDLKGQIIGPGQIVDESFLPALGDSALGVYSIQSYSGALDTPENAEFKEKLQKAYKKEANAVLAINYTAADGIIQAIQAIQGNVENREKFAEALRAVQVSKSLRGALKVDKYGQIIQDQLVRRVDKVKNQYQNTVIDKYPAPTQFWKYDPDTIMKQSSYTRDYPPCKYCE